MRDWNFVEESQPFQMQAILYALPASGNAGADNESPYTVLTSGLEWSQKPVRKATPPPR